MDTPLQHESPLSPHQAFVVQFHQATALERWHVEGRVEHVVSGQATHFHSLEELFTFMAQMLTTTRAPPRRPAKR
jgi:hypothetical protein